MSEKRYLPPPLVILDKPNAGKLRGNLLAETAMDTSIPGSVRANAKAALEAAISRGEDFSPVLSKLAKTISPPMAPEVARLKPVQTLRLLSRVAPDLDVRTWSSSVLGMLERCHSPSGAESIIITALRREHFQFLGRVAESISYIRGLN